MKPDLRHPSILLSPFTLVALLLVLLAGCSFSPGLKDSALMLDDMTIGEEVALGKSAYRQLIQKKGGTYLDANLTAYIDDLGRRLARQSKRPELPFSFTVINDSVPNAFALPAGYIAVTRGLLLSLSGEAELSALLSHQIGHVTAGHSLQGIRPEALRGTTDGEGDSFVSGTFVNLNAGVVTDLLDNRYSPEQEAEADRLGIDTMVKAGCDPSGAVRLQELFSSEVDADAKSPWSNGLFRSHPFATERLSDNRRYIFEHYPLAAGEEEGLVRFSQASQGLAQTRQGYATYDQARQSEKLGRLAVAISLYHQALLEAPDEALIMSSLGLAYLRNDDLVPARRYLIKAVNRQGDYYQSRLALGYVYQQKQRHAKALAQLDAGYRLLPTLEGGYMLAEARENNGDKEGARKLYKAVAKADATGKLGRNAAQRLRELEQ